MNKFCTLALAVSLSSTAVANNAVSVADSLILDGNVGNENSSLEHVLGPTDKTSLSLGGPGAYVTVKMASPIGDQPGLDFTVNEVGDAQGGQDESYRVLVSDSGENGSFVEIGIGRAVSVFDISSSGYDQINYVKLIDLATETLETKVPGSDINSIVALNTNDGTGAAVRDLSAEIRSSSVVLNWTPADDTRLASYAIRVGRGGTSFDYRTAYTASEFANGAMIPLDTSNSPQPLSFMVTPVYADGTEGSAAITKLDLLVRSIPLISSPLHIGDGNFSSWDDPQSDRRSGASFQLDKAPVGGYAELSLELYDTDFEFNRVLVNGIDAVVLPLQADKSFVSLSVKFPAELLVQGNNILEFVAADQFGSDTGNLDDYQVNNVTLKYSTVEN
ncbi:hypothetical protein CHH28_10430 [Bacterioplanes sanyensis]|uniref:Fibronectin type-III domain-containing protein n=1 Tax=Bacterioplanes sanyensis TaxID=1249553 RepID=A0A222FJZ8_9GAMM|nr:hypothetical protein [Bacterioplanes sanyensis]ASP39069.1 hypothetical protein CHH28_10430 [Bacterioplanes sanyensis]